MLTAAVDGLASGARSGPAGILAITVLTSLNDAMLAHSGIPVTAGKLTSKRAKVALEAGVEGVVCSVKELGVVNDVAPGLLKVTPGIRLEGEAEEDQRRVATPVEAVRRGADLLVIGRPITRSPDPRAAAEQIARILQETTTPLACHLLRRERAPSRRLVECPGTREETPPCHHPNSPRSNVEKPSRKRRTPAGSGPR